MAWLLSAVGNSGFTVSLSISPKSRQLKPPSSQFFSLLLALNWNPDYFTPDSSQLDYPGSINLNALSGLCCLLINK